jgi:4-cresol dehydrogenase (hydroxylating)
VPWRRSPADETELARLLREARAAGQPVHLVSTGRNWGYGSFLPSRDGTALIDLGAWQQIGPLDPETLSVRIQPGVTQGQLHAWLQQHAPALAFNVTGAGRSTSVIGCALERGIGYAGPMERSIFGLEVMLADGTVIRPDPAWFHPARDQAAGPSYDALFAQSNYAVVLAARVRLRQRQEVEQAVVLQGELAPLLESLRAAYAAGVLTLPTHIGEPGRTDRLAANRLRELRGREVTEEEIARVFPESGRHVALTALHGRNRVVNAAWKELRRCLSGGVSGWRMSATGADRLERLARVVGLRNQADRLAAFRPLLGLTWGVPTDIGLQALPLAAGEKDADLSAEGAIYGNAVSALTPAAAAAVAAIIRSGWKDAACTCILLNAHCLVSVYTLHFADADADAAHAAEKSIAARLQSAGYPPYRLGINLEGPAAGGLHSLIKSALDPAAMLSPGRYEKRCAAE